MKLLKALLFILISINLLAFDTVVQNVPVIFKQDKVADVKFVETQSDEFTNCQVVITIQNGILLNTVNNYNVVSGDIFSNEFEVNGTIGTNRIVIKINEDTTDLDTFSLVNVYVIPLCDECEIKYDIGIYGTYVSQDNIIVAKKQMPPKEYISYFTNAGKWWTGTVIINNRDESITLYVEFHIEGNIIIKQYTVNSKDMYVIPMYNDNDLKDKTGWFVLSLPSKVKCFTLIGDGVQSYKF